MKAQNMIEHADYSHLAESYAKYRPGYSPDVLNVLLTLGNKDPGSMDCVDVGAGTGIWTRMLARKGCRVKAVEPNAAMRAMGKNLNGDFDIQWCKGSAEDTGLSGQSADIVTMASSFHWTDFDAAVKEFIRLLRPRGYFMALWNPRIISGNTLLEDIENKLNEIVPDMVRVSSGRSEFCQKLTERFEESPVFRNVVYLEGRHVEKMDRERYIGVWRSVNDVQAQAGPEKFERFLRYIEDKIKDGDSIEAQYLTRAWIVQKRS
jgi:ubiquinone/menaquinone biosynthesis C-methylase UbiE